MTSGLETQSRSWQTGHVGLNVSDLARSQRFYDAALQPLGIARLYADGERAAGYGREGKAYFWIAEQDRAASRSHVAFSAPSREAVSAFHVAALQNGGIDNGLPGLRPNYHDDYFAAFVFDPDGNNVEAVIQ